MTATTRTLVATLRNALQDIASALGLTREGVDAIGQEAVRLREGLAALGALLSTSRAPGCRGHHRAQSRRHPCC
jgi:hypothetical protein